MILRLLIDECCPPETVRLLVSAGHDCLYVPDSLVSADDRSIGARAILEDRILITEDQGFGERVVRHGLALPGLVVLHLDGWRRHAKAERVLEIVRTHGSALRGHLVNVDKTKVRSRVISAQNHTRPMA